MEYLKWLDDKLYVIYIYYILKKKNESITRSTKAALLLPSSLYCTPVRCRVTLYPDYTENHLH